MKWKKIPLIPHVRAASAKKILLKVKNDQILFAVLVKMAV